MEADVAKKMIYKAQELIRQRKVDDVVEVDELENHPDWQRDTFVEVSGGTYVKAWIFVPEIP